MNDTHKRLVEILKKDDRLVVDDKLAKNKVIELALQLDADLLKLLRSSKDLSKTFFQQVDNVVIFDKAKFQSFVSNKQFLPDSFTEYKNKTGLSSDKQYLTDSEEVVLAFPYKDCVLEGGQTKEDARRSEVFWNETLAPDEIDKLLEPKVLTNLKKYDSKGGNSVKNINTEDNLIIKGNNLLALHTLKKTHKGKVRLIYIDPPYNTGSDSFQYNDNFNHSAWLVFMRNRLVVARTLLKKDGVIFVQCDDSEQAYLKVLLDEVFSRENYLNTITIKAKASSGASGGGEDKRIKKNTEYLLVYQASDEFDGFNDVFVDKPLKDYVDERKELSKNFAYKTVFVNQIKKTFLKTIKSGRGDDIKIHKINNPEFQSVSKIAKDEKIEIHQVYEKYFESIFTLENAQTSIRGRILDAVGVDDDFYVAEYIPVSGRNKGKVTEVIFGGKTKRLLSWLKNVAYRNDADELIKRDKIGTLWDDLSWSSVSMEGGVTLDNGKKPESLLERVIEMTTEEGDLVIDYHLGSGTTCAVAHKMNRKYIGIEQLDYGEDDSVVRLNNVIKGDKTGSSKNLNWKGGGSFIYAELAKSNQLFIDKIQSSKNTKELLRVWDEMKKTAFLSYKVKPEEVDATKKDFESLSFEDQQKFLISTLDKNLLYIPYSEIEDKTYKVSKEDIALNNKFYGRN